MAGCESEEFLQAGGWGCVDGLLQLNHLVDGRGDLKFAQQQQAGGVIRVLGLP
ncbi:hypothetical protein D3C79_811880 [compost metagenome]